MDPVFFICRYLRVSLNTKYIEYYMLNSGAATSSGILQFLLHRRDKCHAHGLRARRGPAPWDLDLRLEQRQVEGDGGQYEAEEAGWMRPTAWPRHSPGRRAGRGGQWGVQRGTLWSDNSGMEPGNVIKRSILFTGNTMVLSNLKQRFCENWCMSYFHYSLGCNTAWHYQIWRWHKSAILILAAAFLKTKSESRCFYLHT